MISGHLSADDTIAAIATAPGGSARGIVRIAGSQVIAALSGCFRADDGQPLAEHIQPACIPGYLELADLGGRRLPCEIYLWPTARSYCRSPMAEIHTIGSPPLLAAALRSVCAYGVRGAEPGEFTLRAFLGGRIDLAQAEAVLGVIDAGGEREFRVALEQLSGGLSQPLLKLREILLDMLAHLEAGLDFVEEDIDFISAAELEAGLQSALIQVEAMAAQMTSRTEAGSAPRIVLRGLPNAGKSSLLNAMLRQFGSSGSAGVSAALVSPQPGTTRDYLIARLKLGDLECELIDIAGLEENEDLNGPDLDAQNMARQQIARADLEILCIDSSRQESQGPVPSPALASRVTLIALTKCDLPRQAVVETWPESTCVVETSATTGAGLATLADAIRAVCEADQQEGATVAATAQRCRDSLTTAAASLREAQRLATVGGVEELLAAEIRTALHSLGQVAGTIYTDDILDRVFSRFCIGK